MHGPRWPYSSLAVGHGFGWTSVSTWSLKLKEIAGAFPHGDGSIPRGKEQKLQKSLRVHTMLLLLHFIGKASHRASPDSRV